MKEFIEELKYMCTSSKAKGFYIFVTIVLVALILGCFVSLIMMVVNLIAYKAFSALWLVLFLVTLIITIAVIIWLKKS